MGDDVAVVLQLGQGIELGGSVCFLRSFLDTSFQLVVESFEQVFK